MIHKTSLFFKYIFYNYKTEILLRPQKLYITIIAYMKTKINCLTKRELEVCKYLILGLDNEQIAENLYISKHTVKSYVSSIIDTLGAKNRTEVAYILGKNNIM